VAAHARDDHAAFGAAEIDVRRVAHAECEDLARAANRMSEERRRNLEQVRESEEALRESEGRLRALIEASPAAISFKDRNGRYLLVNREFLRHHGKGLEDVLGKAAGDFMRPEMVALVNAQDTEIRRTGTTLAEETVTVLPDGMRLGTMVVKFAVRGGDGEIVGIGSVTTDVSGMKSAEEEARKLQVELAHVGRLTTMGEMAGGIAHELNQPLAAIQNYAQGGLRRLRGGGLADADYLRMLEIISGQATRAGNIIRRIRAFVRKGAPERARADLNNVVREVVADSAEIWNS
jgi:PAS domain S-box-containing protein